MISEIEVMRRFVEEYQTGVDESVADELLAPDFIDHTPFPGLGSTREAVKQLFSLLRAAFPDLKTEIIAQIAQGDRVGTYKVFSGTHRGPLLGITPTDRKVSFAVLDIVRIVNGRIAEHWNVVDQAEMRQISGSDQAAR